MIVTKKLWIALAVVFFGSFMLLGNLGRQIYQVAPPIPAQVVVAGSQTVLFTKQQIENGQNVWQSMGGMEVGSIWGHGSYLPPDWSADWLHREAVSLLDIFAKTDTGKAFELIPAEAQAGLKARLIKAMRTNTYDAATGTLTVSAERAEAIVSVQQQLWTMVYRLASPNP